MTDTRRSSTEQLPHVHFEALDEDEIEQVIQAVLAVQMRFPRNAASSEAAAAGAMIAAVCVYQVGGLPKEHAHRLLDLCWEKAEAA